MDLRDDFVFTSVSGRIPQTQPDPFTPLDELIGTWKGHGFNQIWRPFHGSQDRFLELNETNETLEFARIPGDIPNRGFLQDDINLHGIRYLQQVQDANVPGPGGKPSGIHVEPGLWLKIPVTTDPANAVTVARLASIPHGTSFVAQGVIFPTIASAPPFATASITPFTIAAPHTPVPFPESNLSTPTTFRTPSGDIPHVTQAMLDNPNSVLSDALVGRIVTSTTTLKVSTLPLNPPATGGGTSNIAFLQGAAGGPNALDFQVDATFWIEEVKEADGTAATLLQYSQRVLLNFNGLSWPHFSVATLVKQR